MQKICPNPNISLSKYAPLCNKERFKTTFSCIPLLLKISSTSLLKDFNLAWCFPPSTSSAIEPDLMGHLLCRKVKSLEVQFIIKKKWWQETFKDCWDVLHFKGFLELYF